MPSAQDTELLDRLDEVIAILERDEIRFYVEIDLVHQLRGHLAQTIELVNSDHQ